MVLFTFSVFDWKYSFCANFVQKIEIISLSLNLMQHYMVVYILCFFMKIPFLKKFCSKRQNCHFKLKFGTGTNSDMQNSLVMFTFSVFD